MAKTDFSCALKDLPVAASLHDEPEVRVFLPDEPVDSVWAEPVCLHLQDLLPDERGEVVLHGGGETALMIGGATEPVQTGVAGSYTTAGGFDVTGLKVYALSSGLTIYSDSELVFTGKDCLSVA
ncbi:hypothetical protein [Kiloniella sp. b19]|uniref:hypothetical protein n=1 Tax=Kiloniella sp. GXU_MW_B19 TaxID=3141326 RepID=UPI0031DFF264